jgi:tetratricopeptide (TPR) repeat protein
VLCVASAVLPRDATGQVRAPSEPRQDPRALLQQADSAYDVRDYERALSLYRRAYEQLRDPSILFNVGRMLEALSRWSDAADTWALYLERLPDAPNRAETERAIREARARIRSAPEVATPVARSVSSSRVAPPALPAPSAPSAPRGGVGPWILVGVGGAAAVTGAVFTGLYASSVAELNGPAHCTPDGQGRFDCDPSAVTIRDRAVLQGTVGAIALGAGGAAAVGGLLWWITGRSAEATVVVAPRADGGSLSFFRRF